MVLWPKFRMTRTEVHLTSSGSVGYREAKIDQIKAVSKIVNSWSSPIVCVQLVAHSHCYGSGSYHTCK